MMRAAGLTLLLLFISTPALGQSVPPRFMPLRTVFRNLGKAPISTAVRIAKLQAKDQWKPPKGKMDRGPDYKSTPQLNSDPNRVVDNVFFEGYFTPLSSTSKLIIFSDDGCDVVIRHNDRATRVLANFGKGQHLPNIDQKQSFHVISYPFTKGELYFVSVHYSNTVFNGPTDIDGLTVFCVAGGGTIADASINTIGADGKPFKGNAKKAVGTIVIANKDDVYADKDEPAQRRPVTIKGPAGAKVEITRGTTSQAKDKDARAKNLKLYKEKDAKGKDLFEQNGDGNTITLVPQAGDYWLEGGALPSEKVRDQFLQARLNMPGAAVDQINITVLWTELTARNSGALLTNKNGAYDGFDAAKKIMGVNGAGNLLLGVRRSEDDSEEKGKALRGRIELRGDIQPVDLSTYTKTAFDKNSVNFVDGKSATGDNKGSPATADFGFIFRRMVKVNDLFGGRKELGEEGHDDSARLFQDIHPDDPDGKGKALIIVDFDAPSCSPILDLGFQSRRFNATEHIVFNYLAKTPERCSKKLLWAFSADIALGFGNNEDKFKPIFLFGDPNDNTKENPNTVNEVLIEGQGGYDKGKVDLKFTLAKPTVDSASTDPNAVKKTIASGKPVPVFVKGKNLIGVYSLRHKDPKLADVLAVATVVVVDNKKPHFGDLKFTITFFDTKQVGKDYEFDIDNIAGKSDPVKGFEVK